MTRTLGVIRSRTASNVIALACFYVVVLLATVSPAKTPLARSPQDVESKASALRWDPPSVDAPISALSTASSCSLPDVLKQAGQRAEQLVDHLQMFVAREQIRYQQTDRLGTPEISLAPTFEYLVDFGKSFEPLKVHETRTPLAGTKDVHLGSILDKGMPVLALIFHPAVQADYEMRCEGATHWNHQPAWLIQFRQMRDKRPRTLTMETPVEVYPRVVNATELRPLSIKGRAWIAADSGQVMHLETNLVGPILTIDLSEIAISVDYAPVKSHSQNLEVWLPKFVVAYTDYAQRRMIIEHTFSDFQLFSVQTKETIHKPKDP
ncbi:MAG: hypothetical protein WA853_04975 [Candidatus Acidiferrum sp.]